MRENILQQVDSIVEILYSVDKVGLDKAFVVLVESLFKLVEEENLINSVEFNQILVELESAYTKKDLVDLADVLLYKLKVFLE